MENIPEWIEHLPGLAPGIIIGATIGFVAGVFKPGDSVEGVNAYQLGGLGAVVGALFWYALFWLS